MAVDVIRRRSPEQRAIEGAQRYRLDLCGCDFSGVDVSRGNFQGARLMGCRFQYVDMSHADFSAARSDHSVLKDSYTAGTKLIGADMRFFWFADEETRVENFFHALGWENVFGLNLMRADLASNLHGTRAFENTFGTRDTKLHAKWEAKRREVLKLRDVLEEARPAKAAKIEAEAAMRHVSGGIFRSWSTLYLGDLALDEEIARFRRGLGLTGWPYEG